MPEIQINDQSVSFRPGQTLLEVCGALSIHIPTLCHLKGTVPTGDCGVCLVEDLTQGTLVRACFHPAQEGMVIRTESAAVKKGRRAAIEALIASGNHNCGVASGLAQGFTQLQMDAGALENEFELCPAWGDCRLQDLAYEYQARVTELGTGWEGQLPDMDNPMIIRDYSRCIGCGRCVKACNEVQVNQAIEMNPDQGKPQVPGSHTLMGSKCVFCGECVRHAPWAPWWIKKAGVNGRPSPWKRCGPPAPIAGWAASSSSM